MSGLNSQLQDYLKTSAPSKGSTSSLLSTSFDNLSSSAGRWFGSKDSVNDHQHASPDDASNAWFSEAQKDPLLPSLVRNNILIVRVTNEP